MTHRWNQCFVILIKLGVVLICYHCYYHQDYGGQMNGEQRGPEEVVTKRILNVRVFPYILTMDREGIICNLSMPLLYV